MISNQLNRLNFQQPVPNTYSTSHSQPSKYANLSDTVHIQFGKSRRPTPTDLLLEPAAIHALGEEDDVDLAKYALSLLGVEASELNITEHEPLALAQKFKTLISREDEPDKRVIAAFAFSFLMTYKTGKEPPKANFSKSLSEIADLDTLRQKLYSETSAELSENELEKVWLAAENIKAVGSKLIPLPEEKKSIRSSLSKPATLAGLGSVILALFSLSPDTTQVPAVAVNNVRTDAGVDAPEDRPVSARLSRPNRARSIHRAVAPSARQTEAASGVSAGNPTPQSTVSPEPDSHSWDRSGELVPRFHTGGYQDPEIEGAFATPLSPSVVR